MTVALIQLPWEQSGWFEQANTWILEQLAHRNWHATASTEVVHQRPWSAFARVPTDHGMVYFKAPAPMYGYEALLTQALATWRPQDSVPLLAIEPEQGWILSAHAGVTLRQIGQTVAQIDHWLKILPHYSEMQISLVERVPELLAFGMPDRRLAQLPQLYAGLAEIIDKSWLSEAEHQQMNALQTHFADLCDALASYGIPETITHEEIHENNVLLGDAGYIFTDWSDSSVSHPFLTMLVTLSAASHWLKLDQHSPELQKLRHAYLEPWTRFATRARLEEALALALRIGTVNRALSWNHCIGYLSEKHKQAYGENVAEWLQDFLQAEAVRADAT